MKRPIFIHYETKSREFDGKLLLIANLLKHFDTIYFGSFTGIKRESLFHSNGIMILKSLSKVNEPFYKKLKERGYQIFLLHAEGGIYQKDTKDVILSLFNPDMLEYVDSNFVFGEAIRDDIIKHCGTKFTEKTIASGEPRFDLLKSTYNTFFNEAILKLEKKYGDYFLINTDFPLVNSYVGNKQLFEYLMNEPSYSNEFRDGIVEKREILKVVLASYLEAIKYLASKFPKINFIIRPHPSESEELYIKECEGISNVIVSKEYNVANWILASKGVIHYDCTTGMEAALAQKPVISFLPKINKQLLVWLPVELSKKVYDKEELAKEIKNIINKNFNHQIEKALFDDWSKVINNVKHTSSDIILDRLNSIAEVENSNREGRLWDIILLRLQRLRSYLAYMKRMVFPNNKDVSQHSHHKFGLLSRKEVRTKLKKLCSIVETDSTNVYVEKIAKDTVIIKVK